METIRLSFKDEHGQPFIRTFEGSYALARAIAYLRYFEKYKRTP